MCSWEAAFLHRKEFASSEFNASILLGQIGLGAKDSDLDLDVDAKRMRHSFARKRLVEQVQRISNNLLHVETGRYQVCWPVAPTRVAAGIHT